MSEKRERNYSIDVLRILAMLGIVVLHTQSKTGWLVGQEFGSFGWLGSWGIQAVCMLAVNIYVIISGYFLPEARRTTKKVFDLWCVAFFWSLFSIILETTVTNNRVTVTSLVNIILPISTRQYWFLTVYAALYLISPYLDVFLRKLSKTQYKGVVAILIVLFSALPTFIPYGGEDGIVGVNGIGGTNFAWFCVLYLISGYFRRFVSSDKLKKHRKKYAFVFAVSVIVMLGFQFCMELLQGKIGSGGSYGTWFFNYASLFNLSASISAFALFLSFRFSGGTSWERLISFLSGSTFGVYLIHENPYLRPILWGFVERMNAAWLSSLFYPVKILSVSLTIFLVCCLMEQVRKRTFGRMIPKQLRICQKIDALFYPTDD